MPFPVLDAFQKGRECTVPLIIDNNSDDAGVIEALGVAPAILLQKMGRRRLLVRSLYPGVTDERQLGRQVEQDTLFAAFGRRISYLHSAKAPTWRYDFTDLGANESNGLSHGGEVPFALGTVDVCQCLSRMVTPLDRTVKRRIGDRRAAFIGRHRPTGETDWPQDDQRRGQVLEIGDQETACPTLFGPPNQCHHRHCAEMCWAYKREGQVKQWVFPLQQVSTHCCKSVGAR